MMNKLSKTILFTILVGISWGYAQNNLVPNPDFQDGATPTPDSCVYNFKEQDFNNDVDDWVVANHNIDKGIAIPDLIDISRPGCGTRFFDRCRGPNPDPLFSTLSNFSFFQNINNRFVVIYTFESG
ncbi:hypothetical protein JYU20_04220, partial [Bacteroidales bacterium AH-315-I05]|nr:hypothetical protein [Bacteroidales bacterium AH-315-I05]